MSTPTIAPYQFAILDTERYAATIDPFLFCPVIESEAYDSLEIAADLLDRIREDIAIVDFFRIFNTDFGDELRGAILRDKAGMPKLAFSNALLGYDGAAPELSCCIIESLLIPRRHFEAINDAAREMHGGYVIRLMAH